MKCPICGNVFSRTAHNKDKTYCSHRCQYQAQSLGLIRSHCRGNYGYREDLGQTFRSSLEANFARVCQKNGWLWKYEQSCFETPLGFYTPDFWVEEWKSFVELRGFRGRSLSKPIMASRRHGFNLRVIYEDEFIREWGHLRSSITGWEDNKGPIFGMVDPAVYENRVCVCGKKFLHRKSRSRGGTYCSIACANQNKWSKAHGWHKRIKRDVVCGSCGCLFATVVGGKYCSRQCYWKSMKRNGNVVNIGN